MGKGGQNCRGDRPQIKSQFLYFIQKIECGWLLFNSGKVAEYYKSNKKDKEILIDIKKAIDSSIELRSKKELIEGFIDRVNSSKNVTDDFKKFVKEEKEKDLEKVIEEEKLKPEETKKFIDNSLRDGTLKTTKIGRAHV